MVRSIELSDAMVTRYAKKILGFAYTKAHDTCLAENLAQEIPSFISKEERNYLKYQLYPQYAVLYWLSDNGLLRYPTDEEAMRLCTVVWCEAEK